MIWAMIVEWVEIMKMENHNIGTNEVEHNSQPLTG